MPCPGHAGRRNPQRTSCMHCLIRRDDAHIPFGRSYIVCIAALYASNAAWKNTDESLNTEEMVAPSRTPFALVACAFARLAAFYGPDADTKSNA